jgi:hypothetical protein
MCGMCSTSRGNKKCVQNFVHKIYADLRVNGMAVLKYLLQKYDMKVCARCPLVGFCEYCNEVMVSIKAGNFLII